MQKAYIVVDLGFGDSGKGKIVDHLAHTKDVDLVVRYNGGAQCAHNVEHIDGRHHSFAQFGAASFFPQVRTFFSKYAYFNPLTLAVEEAKLQSKGVKNLYSRFYVHEDTLVTTPYHRALNRLKEISRGALNKHGSCGMGIGETVALSLAEPQLAMRVKDLAAGPHYAAIQLDDIRKVLFNQVEPLLGSLPASDLVNLELSTFKVDPKDIIVRMQAVLKQIHVVNNEKVIELFNLSKNVAFEGAQGVLLDQDYGFHPYTTWSDTTSRNAHAIIHDLGLYHHIKTEEIGVVRAYTTRHGAGPFVAESEDVARLVEDIHNPHNIWQEHMRFGWFDNIALNYAHDVNKGVDYLAVTHVDWLQTVKEWRHVVSYDFGSGRELSMLPTLKFPNLQMLEERTQGLQSARPVFSSAYTKEEDMLDKLGGLLYTNIGIISRGRNTLDTINL